MSELPTSKRSPATSRESAGILASLPNTRPQRPSARRAQTSSKPTPNSVGDPAPKASTKAPATASGRAAVKPKASTKPASTKATDTARRKAAPGPKRAAKQTKKGSRRAPQAIRPVPQANPPAPRQGFEVGSEVEQGLAVGPPSSVELAGSIVGLLGEAAQAGLVSGGHLLKSALARLQGR